VKRSDLFVAEACRLVADRVEKGLGLGPDGKTREGATVCVTPTEVYRNVDDGPRSVGGGYRAVEEALRAAGWKSLYSAGKTFFRPTSFEGTPILAQHRAKAAAAAAVLEARRAARKAVLV
jgi:hypothetical protein